MIPKTALWQLIAVSVVFDPNSLVLNINDKMGMTNKVINFKWRKCSKSSEPLIKGNIKYTKSFKLLSFIISFYLEELNSHIA